MSSVITHNNGPQLRKHNFTEWQTTPLALCMCVCVCVLEGQLWKKGGKRGDRVKGEEGISDLFLILLQSKYTTWNENAFLLHVMGNFHIFAKNKMQKNANKSSCNPNWCWMPDQRATLTYRNPLTSAVALTLGAISSRCIQTATFLPHCLPPLCRLIVPPSPPKPFESHPASPSAASNYLMYLLNLFSPSLTHPSLLPPTHPLTQPFSLVKTHMKQVVLQF